MDEQIIENKAKLRELELTVESIISLLEGEGILSKREVEERFQQILNERK